MDRNLSRFSDKTVKTTIRLPADSRGSKSEHHPNVIKKLKVDMMSKFEIKIDHDLCWGCKTCEVACKQENEAPDGIKLIRVEEDGPRLVDDKLDFSFCVHLCRHCDDPPCADVCPEEAIQKRDDDVVVMDYDLCTGCQACIDACPYDAISYDDDGGIASKCNLCHHRVDQGLIPACADNVCPAHCIYFKFAE